MGLLNFFKKIISPESKSSPFPDYVVIDLETTGFSVVHDQIIEVAAVKVADGIIVDTFSTLVNPHAGISRKMEEITHITNLMVADAPSIEEILPQLREFIDGNMIVGHNALPICTFERCHCNIYTNENAPESRIQGHFDYIGLTS